MCQLRTVLMPLLPAVQGKQPASPQATLPKGRKSGGVVNRPTRSSDIPFVHSFPSPHSTNNHHQINMTATADSWEYPTQRKFDDVVPLSEVDPNDKAGKESEIGLPLEGRIRTHPFNNNNTRSFCAGYLKQATSHQDNYRRIDIFTVVSSSCVGDTCSGPFYVVQGDVAPRSLALLPNLLGHTSELGQRNAHTNPSFDTCSNQLSDTQAAFIEP